MTYERRIKIGAARLGITRAEYHAKIAAGFKWCSCGKHWVPIGEFGKNWDNFDGHTPDCLACRNTRQRAYRADNRRRHTAAAEIANRQPV